MMGNMVGAGIFIYPAMISANLPHPLWFLLVWIIGGAIALAGALSSAELGILFPEVGGDYVYLRNAYGIRWAFLYGYLTTFITFPGSIALGVSLSIYYQGSTILGNWLKDVAFILPIIQHPIYYFQLVSAGILLFLTFVNLRGIHSSIQIQKLFTLLPLIFLVLIYLTAFGLILWSFLFPDGTEVVHLKQNYSIPYKHPDLFQLGAALVPVYWTFMGWNAPLTLGGEIKNPHRNIPLIMILGPLVVTVIYLIFAFGFTAIIPYELLQTGKEDPYYLMGKYLLFHFFSNSSALPSAIPTILSILILLLVMGNTNSTMVSGSRISMAIARDKLFLQKIGEVDEKTHAPKFSLWVQSSLSLVMILSFNQESNLLNFSFIAITLLSIMTILSLFIVRKRQSQENLLYKTLGYPFTPLLYVFSSGMIVLLVIGKYLSENQYTEVLTCVFLMAFGLILFEIWKKKSK